MDMKAIGQDVVDWIELAQDNIWWWVVIMALKLGDSITGGNIFNNDARVLTEGLCSLDSSKERRCTMGRRVFS